MPRWITVPEAAVPFDYRWPDRSALTAFTEAGEFFVKDEVADYAVGRGYATEGKASESTTRSSKGTNRRRSARKARNAADNGSSNRVGRKRVAAADRAADRAPVADHSG